MTVYSAPGTAGSAVTVESRYDNFIGGEWTPPVKGQYFENPSPGRPGSRSARSPASTSRGRRARAGRRARRRAGVGQDQRRPSAR